jgi:hypothetical protein
VNLLLLQKKEGWGGIYIVEGKNPICKILSKEG